MKRLLAAILLLVLTVSILSSCGKKKVDLTQAGESTFDYYRGDLSSYLTVKREDYADLTVKLDVTDEEVDDFLNTFLLPSYREPKMATDRAVQNGDTVYIYYTGYIDGVAFEGGSNASAETPSSLKIGSNSFIDTFEEQLIGVIPANTSWENPKQVNVTFPADYGKEALNGKAARFDVVVVGIFDDGWIVPELTEDFARNKVNNFTPETDDPVGEFRLAVKDYLRDQKATDLETRKFNCLMDALYAVIEYKGRQPTAERRRIESDLRESITSYYQNTNFNYYMMYQQVYFDSEDSAARDYLGLRFDADWEAAVTASASRVVKRMLTLNAIAQLEGLEVTEEEVKDWVRKQAKNDDATVESVLAEYSLEEIYAELAAGKAKDFLFDRVTFDYTGLPTED